MSSEEEYKEKLNNEKLSNEKSSKEKSRKKAKNASQVWEYFEQKRDNKNVIRNFCKETKCGTSYSINTASSQLPLHLANEHNLQLIDKKVQSSEPHTKRDRSQIEGDSEDEDKATNNNQNKVWNCSTE